MFGFKVMGDILVLIYAPDFNSPDWIDEKFNKGRSVSIGKVFRVKENDMYSPTNNDEDEGLFMD